MAEPDNPAEFVDENGHVVTDRTLASLRDPDQPPAPPAETPSSEA